MNRIAVIIIAFTAWIQQTVNANLMQDITMHKALTRIIGKIGSVNLTERHIDRFIAGCKKDGPTPLHVPHLGPCWIWTKCEQGNYGKFNIGSRCFLAHRISLAIYSGEMEDGIQACHHCDNPSCVNPSHLFKGSVIDNMADRSKKGRTRKVGNQNPSKGLAHSQAIFAKRRSVPLAENDIREIRASYPTKTSTQLAKAYGISQKSISNIISRKSWKHVE